MFCFIALLVNLSSLHGAVNPCILIPYLLILSSKSHRQSISFVLSCLYKIIQAIRDIVAIIFIVKLSLLFNFYSFKRRRKMLFIKNHFGYLQSNFVNLEIPFSLKSNLTYFQLTYANVISIKTSFCLTLRILNEQVNYQQMHGHYNHKLLDY